MSWRLVPSGPRVEHPVGRSTPWQGSRCGQLLFLGPTDERSGPTALALVAVAIQRSRWPGAGGQREMLCAQPVEKRCRGTDVLAGDCRLVGCDVIAPDASAQASQHVPDGVAVQQLLLFGVAAACDRLAVHASSWLRCSSRAGSAWWRPVRRAGGEGLAGGQFVESLVLSGVFRWPAPEHRDDGVARQPAQRGSRTVDADQRLVQRLQAGRTWPSAPPRSWSTR